MKKKKGESEESKHVIRLPEYEEMRKRLHEVNNAILYTDRLYPILLEHAEEEIDPDSLVLMVLNAVKDVKRDDRIKLKRIALGHLTYGPFLEKVVIALVKDLPEEAFFRFAFHRQASRHNNLIHF